MSSECYTIRPATAEDCDPVAALWAMMADEHHGYDAEFWMWADDAVEHWRERYEQLITDRGMVTLVAQTASGDLAGFVVASAKETSGVFARNRGEVWDLVILPAHRGEGLGTKLMEATFDQLKARGAEDVVLHAAVANQAAQRLYEKLKMRPVMYRMYRRL